MAGWIGVDLDGTLAEYDDWHGVQHIGPPIPKMLERVRCWLAEGKEVRIVTARVFPGRGHYEALVAENVIREWCLHHLGTVLPVTCAKGFDMIELWDDRCVQVVPNTGERVDGRD